MNKFSLKESNKPVILVVDDEKNIRVSLELTLTNNGYEVLLAHDPNQALLTLQERIVDIIMLDIRLGEIDGLALFKKIRSLSYDFPVIFMSGHSSLSEAANAVRIGGYDFIEKPFKIDKVLLTIKRCLEYSSMRLKLDLLDHSDLDERLIGGSNVIIMLKEQANKVAVTNASVLISGESGTGKELVAQIIHDNSNRSSRALIKVNCSAIPENLIESELFGYEKGAFTGAVSSKKGLFEQAHGGTVFLDEVADLSLSAQAKVLRVLQSGEIQKLGSEKKLQCDVRVISATHKNLKELVKKELFREDLLYRLNVVPLEVPSLRERPEDIPLLVYFFLGMIGRQNNIKEKQLDRDVLEVLSVYRWPGNVRELKNVIERALIMSHEVIALSDLPEELMLLREDDHAGNKHAVSLKDFRDRAEKEYIVQVLRKHNGNISKAARDLKIGRSYLHRRLEQLGIQKKDYFI